MRSMFKNNVTMQTTAKFACNATSNICLMLALQALSQLISKRPSFNFFLTLTKFSYETIFGRKSLFHFFVVKVY